MLLNLFFQLQDFRKLNNLSFQNQVLNIKFGLAIFNSIEMVATIRFNLNLFLKFLFALITYLFFIFFFL